MVNCGGKILHFNIYLDFFCFSDLSLLVFVVGLLLPNIIILLRFLFQSSALKWLLQHLECVDLSQSSQVILLLLKILPHFKIYGLARKAETLTCRRVDYIQSLTEEVSSIFAVFVLLKLSVRHCKSMVSSNIMRLSRDRMHVVHISGISPLSF